MGINFFYMITFYMIIFEQVQVNLSGRNISMSQHVLNVF